MLELLIALFLVATCALPLAQLPMRAVQEEIKSSYRMQMQRLADLAFAQIKEKLYRQEIPWKEISSPINDKFVIIDDIVTISSNVLGDRPFLRKGTIHSIGKQGRDGEEWRLITFKVKFQTKDKTKIFRKKDKALSFCYYNYQLLIKKSSTPQITSIKQ